MIVKTLTTEFSTEGSLALAAWTPAPGAAAFGPSATAGSAGEPAAGAWGGSAALRAARPRETAAPIAGESSRASRGRRRGVVTPERIDGTGRRFQPLSGPALVPDLVGLPGPFGERQLGLPGKQVLHRDPPLLRRKRYLGIDEVVVETDVRGVLAGVAVIHGRNARPVYRRQAHRARLAARIERAIGQLEDGELPAGLADRDDFRVRRRIARGGDLVAAPPYDAPVPDHDASERSAPSGADAVPREADRFAHEVLVGGWRGHRVAGWLGRKIPKVLWR